MRTVLTIATILLVGGNSLVSGQGGLKSGPQPGEFVPGSFNFFHVNPPPPKDKPELDKGIPRFRCPILDYEHKPVLMIFAKEPAKDQEEAFDNFLKKFDDVLQKHWSNDFAPLRGIVIFLSKDGKSSVTEKNVDDPFAIVKEAENRQGLFKRIEKKGENLKRLALGFTILEGPANYKLNPQAEMTLIFYQNLKGIESVVFGPGQPFSEEAGEKLLTRVDEWVTKAEKK